MKKALFCAVLLAVAGCDPGLPTAQDFPILRTLVPTDIDASGVTFRAELLQHGSSEITSYGFVWSPDQNVNASDLSRKNGFTATVGTTTDIQTFELRLDSAVSGGLTYNVRAFATFAGKTVYGNTLEFDMQRSEVSAWARLLHGGGVSRHGHAQGNSNGSSGAVLFGGSEFYLY